MTKGDARKRFNPSALVEAVAYVHKVHDNVSEE